MSKSCLYKYKNIRKLNKKETKLDEDINKNIKSDETLEGETITG